MEKFTEKFDMEMKEIEKMWAEDCKINPEDLKSALTELPSLHAKYFPLLNLEKKNIAIAKAKLNKLRVKKHEFFFSGPFKDDQESKDWELPASGKINRNQTQPYVEADDDVRELAVKVALIQAKIDFLTGIIEMIYKKGFHLKSLVDLRRFEDGY